MTVGIVANTQKQGARNTVDRLMGVLAVRGISAVLERETAKMLGVSGGMDGPELAASASVIAVLGGDGTMLNAMAKLG
ncbi:MAG: hypothetical protein EOP83_05455, partial [Verrucomicrobiaceae bacterium]